jgi:hypothetical protein
MMEKYSQEHTVVYLDQSNGKQKMQTYPIIGNRYFKNVNPSRSLLLIPLVARNAFYYDPKQNEEPQNT